MDLRKLKTLIELVETSGIAELEIQEGEERVRITRSRRGRAPASTVVAAARRSPAAATAARRARAAAPAAPVEAGRPSVKSPMVGTFYRSASPGAKPFVEVGDTVEAATRSASSRR